MHPVVYVIHSVGMGHRSHVVLHGPVLWYVVVVVGQQSVAHGTVMLDTARYNGHTWPGGGIGQGRTGQVACGEVSLGTYMLSIGFKERERAGDDK
jgi:hypothetical protein